MIAHGIPEDWTDRLAVMLRITCVRDLLALGPAAVRRVPPQFRQRIMDVRNSLAPGTETLWYRAVGSM